MKTIRNFTLYILHFSFVFAAALSGAAKTFDVDVSTGKPAASNEAYYHGETIEFRAVRGRSVVTNIEYAAVYYQTNGMGDVWWKTDGLVFHPTNDTGAASYRFFLEGRDGPGRDWHANGLLRLLPSPGFTPNVLRPPVATLDFANIEVFNAPWPGEIAEAAGALTLAIASNETTLASHSSQLSELSQSLANKLDNTGEQTLDGSLTATGFLNAPSIYFPGSSAYIDASDDTILFHSTQKPSGSPFGGQVIKESPLKPDGTAVVTQLGLLPLEATNTMQSAAIASNETAIASNAAAIETNATAIVSHSSQLSQLSQSLDGKLDKGGGAVSGDIEIPYSALVFQDASVKFTSSGLSVSDYYAGDWLFNDYSYNGIVRRRDLESINEAISAAATTNAVQEAHLSTVDGRLDSLDSQISGNADAADIPPAVSNTVTTTYIRERLGVYLYVGADGGIYVHTNED